MKLEVGKFYKNRDGEIVEIVHFDASDPDYPFKDYYGEWYTETGEFYTGKSTAYDLIEEVKSNSDTNINPLDGFTIEQLEAQIALLKSQRYQFSSQGKVQWLTKGTSITLGKLTVDFEEIPKLITALQNFYNDNLKGEDND